MNLAKLFETQRILDARIMEKHPELVGQNNLDWKILALQVELGECANEWRGFKKWSNNREPRTKLFTWIDGLGKCVESTSDPRMLIENGQFNAFRIKNPLLEEYVDCLHFILSIGLEHQFENKLSVVSVEPLTFNTIEYQFVHLMRTDWEIYEEYHGGYYHEGLEVFLGLGEKLGFTWEQIEQAYYEKNEINHERQEAGY